MHTPTVKITPNAINRISITAWLTARGFLELELADRDLEAQMIETGKSKPGTLAVYKSPFDELAHHRLYVYRKTNMFKDETLDVTGFLSDFISLYYSCSIEDILAAPDRFGLPKDRCDP